MFELPFELALSRLKAPHVRRICYAELVQTKSGQTHILSFTDRGMNRLEHYILADRGQPAREIRLVDRGTYANWVAALPPRQRAAVVAQKLKPTAPSHAILPGDAPDEWSVVGVVDRVDKLTAWCLAHLADVLPEGVYRIVGREPDPGLLGWILAQYSFDRYRERRDLEGPRVLLSHNAEATAKALALAAATQTVRDLVNTPASDLGPAEFESEIATLAAKHDGVVRVTRGEELQAGYPMIHAVGQAAMEGREPRLIELQWGDPAHPRIAVIGKGVCFDTGGLFIKSRTGMRLMKKDMGGAAHAIALAELVMAENLPVRLHMLVPAVENSISSASFRPGDVLRTRLGLTVENTNTDAEGRLILGDALARACEEGPELIIDFATLTGAARIALGPEIVPLFSNDDELAIQLMSAGISEDEPLWRMPLWDGYEDMLSSDIADLLNSAEGDFAGPITAALFLRRFISIETHWAHFDVFAWRPKAKPGRAKGGDAFGLRAAWKLLLDRYRR